VTANENNQTLLWPDDDGRKGIMDRENGNKERDSAEEVEEIKEGGATFKSADPCPESERKLEMEQHLQAITDDLIAPPGSDVVKVNDEGVTPSTTTKGTVTIPAKEESKGDKLRKEAPKLKDNAGMDEEGGRNPLREPMKVVWNCQRWIERRMKPDWGKWNAIIRDEYSSNPGGTRNE
jgi:hypothetical protein